MAADSDLSNWTPPPLPPRTAMQGRYVRLEPLEPGHYKELFEAFKEDREDAMWRYLPTGPYASVAEYAKWAETVRALHDPIHYTALMEDGRLGGTLSMMRINPKAGSAEVGWITYAPRMQRTREATEAVYLIMQWCLDNGYRRFEWKCNNANEASKRAAMRYGFTAEGVHRQALVVKGENRDTAWFSILDSEWPAIREAFEAWLDPANFDEKGRQFTSLNPSLSGG